MKSFMKIITCIMVLTMTVASFAGCALVKDMDEVNAYRQQEAALKEAEAQMAEIVMTINDDIEVSGGYYGWYFSNEYNSQYSQAKAVLEADSSADSSAEPEIDIELVKANVNDAIAEIKLAHKKAVDAGIKLTSKDKDVIKQQLASMKSQINANNQGYNISFEDYLLILNTNETYLTQIIEEEYMGNLYFASLLTDSYASTKHIVVDYADGSLTKDEAVKAAEEIKAQLDGGADFEKLMDEKSQDQRDENGNLVNKDVNTFSLLGEQSTTYIEAALNLDEGEISEVIVDDGAQACYILKRYPLDLTAIVNNLLSLSSDSIEGMLISAERASIADGVEIKETDKIKYYTEPVTE